MLASNENAFDTFETRAKAQHTVAAGTLAAAAVAFAMTFVSSAAAGESMTLVRLDYAAAKSCPDAAAFTAQMKFRAPHVSVVSDANAREVKVRIISRGKHFSGRISIADTEGESLRSVEGDDCAEIVTALAVIGAFTLEPLGSASSQDGLASTNESTASTTEGEHRDTGTVSVSRSSAGSERKGSAKPDAPKPETSTSPATPDRAAEDDAYDDHSNAKSRHLEFSFGAQAEAITGVAPGFVGSVPVFVEISVDASKRTFSPAARARFERPGSDADATAQGSAHFTWTEASLDICPISLWVRASWRLQPCLRTEVGVVEGTGLDTSVRHDETRPWATMGAVAISRWSIIGPLFVELEGALIVPIVRDRFYLDPQSATVFRASPVGGSAACGAGISIW